MGEAVVNIFDVDMDFTDKDQLMSFMKKSIDTVFYHESELMKDQNFIDQKSNSGEEDYSILDKPVAKKETQGEFKAAWQIFESARFNETKKPKCHKCGCSNFYNISSPKHPLQCKACGAKMSFITGTYLTATKLPFSKILRIVHVVCRRPDYSSRKVANYAGVTQVSGYRIKYICDSVIDTISSRNISSVLSTCLTLKGKIKIKWKKKFNRKLTPEDVLNIRRCYKEKIYTSPELGKMYNLDPSSIRKVACGKLYKNLGIVQRKTFGNAVKAENVLFDILDEKLEPTTNSK